MSRRAATSTSAHRILRHSSLLVGVSALALVIAAPQVHAKPLGNLSATPSQAAVAAAQSAGQDAAKAARDASNALKRATLAIQAVQATQQAARDAAKAALAVMPGGIAHGLRPNGLQVAPGAVQGSELWQGANLPTEFTDGDRTKVTVKQTQQKAILNWQTFNVSEKTDLYFDQRAGGADVREWVALNRVLDPSASPSKILGSIKAEGQVYLINSNGIIFGGGSQVNVGTLVASSLSLTNQQFMAGINNPLTVGGGGADAYAMPQFGYLGQRAPDWSYAIDDSRQVPRTQIGAPPADVVVQAGAQISTASGGKAMLFAPHVINSGVISAPDGQVILAAGEQVYLRTSLLPDPTMGDPSTYFPPGVRGLDVAVSAAMPWMFSQNQFKGGDTRAFTQGVKNIVLPEMEARAAAIGYRVVNNGIVQSGRGNITVTAHEITQNGVMLASTALNNREGSIRLQAWGQGIPCAADCENHNFFYWAPGAVTLTSSSVTAAFPDLSDTSEIELSSLATRYKPGRVELRGDLINIEAQASVVVPSGTISVVASKNPWAAEEPGLIAETPRDGSRVYIGEGAYLSVAGLQDVLIAMERNVVEAELRINELRDSPLLRDSWLRGQKIYVDRRLSGQFTDGPMAGVNWVKDEDDKYIPGLWWGTPLADVSAWIGVGKTTLGELSTVGGSILIKSAGSVVTRPGSIIDVSGGSVRYLDGWVNTTRLLSANGGTYDISQATPDMVYVGIAGQYKRANSRWNVTEVWTNPLMPSRRFEKGYTEGRSAGSFQLYAAEGVALEGGYWGGVVVGERQAASGKLATAGALTIGGSGDDDRQWLLGNLIISKDALLLPAGFNATTPLGSSWYSGSPGNTDSYQLRTTYLDADVLEAASFGKIDLFVSKNFTLAQGTTLELAPGSSFSVRANSTDAVTQDFKIDGVIHAPGGNVALLNAERTTIGSTGGIDVRGEWVNNAIDTSRMLRPVMDGGNVHLSTVQFEPGGFIDVSGGGWYDTRGAKPKLQVGDAGSIDFDRIGADQLEKADLRAYAAGSGGSLTFLTSSPVQIGGEAPAAGTLHLSETLFSERGFRLVDITSGNITVRTGTTVTQNLLSVDLSQGDFTRIASGSAIRDMGALTQLPLFERVKLAPTSLTLSAGSVTVEAGAAIQADIGGNITIKTGTGSAVGITIAGRLETPGGKINLESTGGGVTVTDTGALGARGAPVIFVDNRGLRSGSVLGGGTVAIDARNVELKSGSFIDVSGASAEIDIPQGGTMNKGLFTSLALDSGGGTISVKGLGSIEGTWAGNAGGSSARGGSVSIESLPGGSLILSARAAAQPGLIFRPSVLESGGFADLALTSTDRPIRLGGVNLTLGSSISITGSLMNDDGTDSRLSAPYISLRGNASSGPTPAGTLSLIASLIDVKQSGIRGFSQTVLEASDIRFSPFRPNDPSSLNVDGTLILRAAQVYPASQTTATIKAGDKIIVQQNGTAGQALSVGGILSLDAPVIEQGGTLSAPFGQIVLKASDTITLLAGSVTSVTGDGLILPYGNLENNEQWVLPPLEGQSKSTPVTSLPEKRITLQAPNVELANGSVVDIRGGGDLYAWEHAPGPGGSHDVLTRPGMYAIIPALGNAAAPSDGALRSGDRIWLAGGNGVPAGWYTLLPARYALLPGAYAIQMVNGSTTQVGSASKASSLADGSMVMGGYLGNAYDGMSSRTSSSWRVMSGDVIRAYSEYNEAFANTFFASDAFKQTQYRETGKQIVTPRLPMDGGSVVFKATQELILNGHLRSQAANGGRGGLVDIAADKIAVLGAGQDAATLRASGYLVIDSANLSSFGAGSLLIGGVRSGDAQGLRVDVTADNILVRNDFGSALTGSEIILAASETIDIGGGSVIAARGEAPTGAGDLVMAPQVPQTTNNNGTPNYPNDDFVEPARDWGTLVRVSNGDAVRVRRTNVDTTVGGVVTIGAGAVINGGKTLLIDATNNAHVAAGAQLSGDALSLAAGRIGFGGGSGLVLDAAGLAALSKTQHLTLRSYTSIDLYRAVDLTGLNAVTFDAAAIVGYGSNDIAVVGKTLVLENTDGQFAEPVGVGHGRLNLTAEELVFGLGNKALRGFDSVALNGTTRIAGEGSGSLNAGAATLTFAAPVITGRGGANQSVMTTGTITVASSGDGGARDLDSLGTRWSLTGRSIDFGARIDALGGAAELTATNGNVVLTAGSLIDVGGFGKQFFDVTKYTDAGRIALTANGGSVLMQAGAMLDLSAHPNGGGAGSLALVSDGGQVTLDGTMKAQAAAGQRGASFSLDIGALSNFAELNQRLNAGGFSGARDFRVRNGDVTVDGTTITEAFTLSADHGRVTIAGTVDARATYGGLIAIYGGNGLTMTNTSVLRAGATDIVDNLGSGRITLGVSSGSLAIAGGLIDAGGGEGGKVTLRAPLIERPGSDTVNVSFAGNIVGAREIVLEGYKQFDLAALATNPNFVGVSINSTGQAELDLAAKAAGKLNVLADHGTGTLVEFVRDFDISGAYGNLGDLAGQANFHARPGMELSYAGDIVLKSNWNLGAGIVNQASAIAAGVMISLPALPGRGYVAAGKESELLRDHTTMVYRTGGSIFGEPGVLTLRSEGDLILKGSITDGFFQYADPLDPTYLAVKGTTSGTIDVLFNGGRSNVGQNLTAYSGSATTLPTYYGGLTFLNTSVAVTENLSAPPQIAQAPYSPDANSPAANTGNVLAYAVMFPSITKTNGSKVAVSSWSQALVAGATPQGESADPVRLAAGSAGKVILSEQPAYNYIDSQATFVLNAFLDAAPNFSPSTKGSGGNVNPSDWLAVLESASGTRLNDNSSFALSIGQSSDLAYDLILNLWNEFAAAKNYQLGNQYRTYNTSVGDNLRLIMAYSTFKDFYTNKLVPNLPDIAKLFPTRKPGASGGAVYPTTIVRTGTGDINIVARGDLQLDGGASIYTAGRRDLAVFDDFTTAPANATYTTGGGHLRIDVGGNINVELPTDRTKMQHYEEWLPRQGVTNKDGVFTQHFDPRIQKNRPGEQSTWWVDYLNFQRGVGALGGGNVTVSAGGDLDNLTVALPTNGRVRGGRTTDERKLLELRNGGAMTVEADGAIRAGYYYIGRGAGSIEAGEFAIGREVKITSEGRTTAFPIAPILSIGDATLDVRTAGDLLLQAIIDPLLIGKGEAYMSSLTERSGLSLTSVGGNVVLAEQTTYLSKDNPSNAYREINNYAANHFPSRTQISALNGSFRNLGSMHVLPGANPELSIIAAGDVMPGSIAMSRGTPEVMSSPLRPANGSGGLVSFDLSGGNPQHLPNMDDYEPSRIYALTGSIIGSVSLPNQLRSPFITTNEQTWFRAGMDVRNIYYDLRNVHSTDVSLLEAGNDIIGGVGTVQQPFFGGIPRAGGQIQIQGPGALVLSAGRDVYGRELALYSSGNRGYDQNNRPVPGSDILGLPSQGAAITVMAGLHGKQPSYEAFVAAYLDPANAAAMPTYLTTMVNGQLLPIYLSDAFETRKSGQKHQTRTGLTSFVEEITGEKLSPLDAWARFRTLPQFTQERFVRQVYMQELRDAGSDQLQHGTNGLPLNGGYNRGYTAIEKLFPGQDWKGSVTIGNAFFRTMAGGDIDVLAPGGGLQVAALGTDVASGFGLVTLGPGDINIFARNNVTVNRSRILTFVGGDEVIWSTLGDIDAGRGAKTTRVATAPEIRTDFDTVTDVLERADISGSGIGTIIGFTGVQEGDVHLIAPKGTVNAGDAGVRVSGNLTVAAFRVLNADNFKVQGEVKGVPRDTGPVNLTVDSRGEKAAANAATAATQSDRSAQPSIIIVEVLGFGGGGSDPNPENEQNRKKDERQGFRDQGSERSYNDKSAVQIAGYGVLSESEAQVLTPDERAKLSGR